MCVGVGEWRVYLTRQMQSQERPTGQALRSLAGGGQLLASLPAAGLARALVGPQAGGARGALDRASSRAEVVGGAGGAVLDGRGAHIVALGASGAQRGGNLSGARAISAGGARQAQRLPGLGLQGVMEGVGESEQPMEGHSAMPVAGAALLCMPPLLRSPGRCRRRMQCRSWPWGPPRSPPCTGLGRPRRQDSRSQRGRAARGASGTRWRPVRICPLSIW